MEAIGLSQRWNCINYGTLTGCGTWIVVIITFFEKSRIIFHITVKKCGVSMLRHSTPWLSGYLTASKPFTFSMIFPFICCRKTRHQNVVLFMGWTLKPQLTIITQWCEGTSLYKHLHVDVVLFQINNLFDIARQTAQGMEWVYLSLLYQSEIINIHVFLALCLDAY